MPDGSYEKPDKRGRVLVNSQEQFMEEAWSRVPKPHKPVEERRFVPAEPIEADSEEEREIGEEHV